MRRTYIPINYAPFNLHILPSCYYKNIDENYTVQIKITLFWYITLRILNGGYQSFGGTLMSPFCALKNEAVVPH
jgi:hypothetical protein